jgi:hypothetical protein
MNGVKITHSNSLLVTNSTKIILTFYKNLGIGRGFFMFWKSNYQIQNALQNKISWIQNSSYFNYKTAK